MLGRIRVGRDQARSPPALHRMLSPILEGRLRQLLDIFPLQRQALAGASLMGRAGFLGASPRRVRPTGLPEAPRLGGVQAEARITRQTGEAGRSGRLANVVIY